MRRPVVILLFSAVALACGSEATTKKKSNPLALSDDDKPPRDSESQNEGDIELEGTPTRGEEPPPDDGTSTSKPAPAQCAKDADCNQAGRICDATTSTCVKGCRGTGQSTCPSKEVCQAGSCVPNTAVPECVDDFDCFLGEICNKTAQKCVEGCYTEYDCPLGQICSATTKKCVVQPTGTSSGTSSSGGTVTYCASDGTCNPGGNGSGKICGPQGYCIPGCRTDAHCPGIKICDSVTKMCK